MDADEGVLEFLPDEEDGADGVLVVGPGAADAPISPAVAPPGPAELPGASPTHDAGGTKAEAAAAQEATDAGVAASTGAVIPSVPAPKGSTSTTPPSAAKPKAAPAFAASLGAAAGEAQQRLADASAAVAQRMVAATSWFRTPAPPSPAPAASHDPSITPVPPVEPSSATASAASRATAAGIWLRGAGGALATGLTTGLKAVDDGLKLLDAAVADGLESVASPFLDDPAAKNPAAKTAGGSAPAAERHTDAPPQAGSESTLPWEPRTSAEVPFAAALRRRITRVSRDALACLGGPAPPTPTALDAALPLPPPQAEGGPPPVDVESPTFVDDAVAALAADAGLKRLRCVLVPRCLPECEFWTRYLWAVEQARGEVLAGEAVGGAATPLALPSLSGGGRGWVAACGVSAAGLRLLARAAVAAEGQPSLSAAAAAAATPPPALAFLIGGAAALTGGGALDAGEAPPSAVGARLMARVTRAGAAVAARMLDEAEAREGVREWIAALFDPSVGEPVAPGSAAEATAAAVAGAPPGGFVAALAVMAATLPSAALVARVVEGVLAEIGSHWQKRVFIPRVPRDALPDCRYCGLHQRLQQLNCCVARLQRQGQGGAAGGGAAGDARDGAGDGAGRPGSAGAHPHLRLLVTGDPLHVPLLQEGPVLTQADMKAAQERQLASGHGGGAGTGVAQLLSDMRAFKAANEESLLADFVRWYSPQDWIRDDDDRLNESVTASPPPPVTEPMAAAEGDGWEVEEATVARGDDGEAAIAALAPRTRGHLSARMLKEGNLWCELWARASPLTAADQPPLFDAAIEGDAALAAILATPPSDLFRQLFATALGCGHAALAAAPAAQRFADGLAEAAAAAAAVCREADAAGGVVSPDRAEALCAVYEEMEGLVAWGGRAGATAEGSDADWALV